MENREIKDFPDWDKLYAEEENEKMHWYYQKLDPDFDRTLAELNLKDGTVLDLGTGPATQAIALAERGFEVSATDISCHAIKKAQASASEKGLDIEFIEDDIRRSRLVRKFDLVLDRGLFHVLEPGERRLYLQVVSDLVKPDGYLLLKCFSHLEPGERGPFRFTKEQIKKLFSEQFQIKSLMDSTFQGTLEVEPRALFAVLQKK